MLVYFRPLPVWWVFWYVTFFSWDLFTFTAQLLLLSLTTSYVFRRSIMIDNLKVNWVQTWCSILRYIKKITWQIYPYIPNMLPSTSSGDIVCNFYDYLSRSKYYHCVYKCIYLASYLWLASAYWKRFLHVYSYMSKYKMYLFS